MIRAIIFLLCLPLCPVFAGIGTPFHVTVKDGLPSSTVYYAMQDTKGFIWLCTETGVCRYDGRKFQSFTINSGLADNENFKCFEDREGRIWFLSYNGKLAYYRDGRMHNPYNTPWLSYPIDGAALLNCQQDANGGIWIATSKNEVLSIHGQKVAKQVVPLKPSNVLINKALIRQGNAVKKYICDYKGSVYLVDLLTGKPVFLGSMDDFLRRNISFRPGESLRKNYIVFEKGLLVEHENSFYTIKIKDYGISSNLLSYYAEDTCIWLGCSDGLYQLNRKGQVNRVLEGQIVTSILKDQEQHIWVTTLGNGVYMFRNNAGDIYSLSDRNTHSITLLPDKAQTMIAGHNNGSIIVSGNGQDNILYTCIPKYSRVLDIVPKGHDSVLICTDDNIFWLLERQKKISPVGISNYKNYSAYLDDIWVVTPRSIEVIGRRRYSITPGLPGRITAVSVVSDSVFYVGTTLGFYKFNRNGHSMLLSDTVLKAGIKDIKNIHGRIWIATHGNGLFIVQNDSLIKHVNLANSDIGSGFCEKLYDDHQGGLVWVITNAGLSVFDRNTGKLHSNVPIASGLVPADIRSVFIKDSYVYVASAEGVRRIDQTLLLRRIEPPQLYVTGFYNGKEYLTDPANMVSFPYYSGAINVNFTAVAFEAPKNVIYEYRFDDEHEWHRTQNSELRFVGLKPGTYELLFRARKHNSNWSKPISFTIEVTPLFFQSLWFKGAVGLAILGLVYFILMKRISYIKKREYERNEINKVVAEWQSKALSCQMNPHFIFNSLNTIQQFLLISDEEQGLHYIGEFAMLMRQILENSKRTHIGVNEEIDFLKRYLHLEKVRYDNSFDYTIEIDQGLSFEDIRIPPVMLQPLLENAIKHGISSIQGGKIIFSLSRNGDYLTGCIDDNGRGFAVRESNEGTQVERESSALKILEERLKLAKTAGGKGGYMNIISKKEMYGTAGTIVEVNIPIL